MIERTTIENLLAIAVQATGADEVFASLSATDVTSRSLAGRRLGQPHRMENVTLSITVRAGKRYGQASANVSGETEIQALAQRAIDIARRMPDVPEILPFPGTSTSPPESPVFVAEDGSSAWQRLDAAVVELRENGATRDMAAFGNMSLAENILALASSNGLFLLQRSTLGHAQFRCFTADGRSTGFDERYQVDRGELLPGKLLRSAADTCAAWEDPVEIPPGRITTIFEPRALADMLRPMLAQFSTRAIAQDQSFLRRMDGSSFLGTTMFDPRVTLHSDPWDTRIPSLPFTPDGEVVRVEQWVKSGVISQLVVDRFEANEAASAVAAPTNLILDVAEPVSDLVAGTEYGLLVKGFANLNVLDPKNCLLTGSTRDGVFLIEKGRITKPVRNLVLRETPVYLFKELLEMGVPEATSPTTGYFPMLLPPIKVKDVLYSQHSGLV